MGCKILKLVTVSHVTLTTPFQGWFVADRLGHAIINLPTKFEVPVFTCYGNIKGIAKCRKWGGLGWLGITQGH